MAITIKLSPEVEADLSAQAQERGLRLDTYIQGLLEQRAGTSPSDHISPSEFEAELDALASGSDQLTRLSPAALTRESFYQDHD